MKVVVAATCVLFCLIACSTEDPTDESIRQSHQRLLFGIPQSPLSLDPATTSDLVYYLIAFNIFETLIAVDWQMGILKPALATSWQSDSAGLRWTFQLRPRVVFHDGSPLNAEAVKISLERQFDPRSPYFRSDLTDTYGHFAFSMVQEIRAVDDSTVQFILKCPSAVFLENIASPYFSTIVSPSALKKSGDNFGRSPIGTGPFQFVRWEPERQIVLKRFAGYWNKAAQIDSIDFQIIPSLEIRLQMLKKGELDIITGLSAASVDALYRRKDLNVVAQPLLGTVVVGFNCQTYPFKDARVRRALAQALDKESIVHSVSRGFAIVARGPLPPYAIGYDLSLTSPPFDSVAARETLESLGCQNGLSVELGYISQTDTVRADPLSLAIESYLEKIGVAVEVVRFTDWQTYSNTVLDGRGDVHLFLDGLPSYTRHPDNLLYSHFHSRSPHNYFHYQNPRVDELLEQARHTFDSGRQHLLYRKIQEILLQETPAVFLSHPKAVCVTRRWVKNFRIDPDVIPRVAEAKME